MYLNSCLTYVDYRLREQQQQRETKVKKLMDEGLSTLKMYKKMLKFQAAKDGLDLSD